MFSLELSDLGRPNRVENLSRDRQAACTH
uniref:Uncharacterized protein n=1 Tax=Anguilla anguilla TaxID=7936 RepID=A0A0E9RB92_ANGAN